MRILVAPDKFKGSLGAAEVAGHIAAALRDGLPHADIRILPIADGGEGTAQIICDARGGEWIRTRAHDALGREIEARFAWIADAEMAVFDLAEVAGVARLSSHERDPTVASTFGVGELLLAAQRHGAENIIVGLGGSATNDGGFGMARALGVRFFDEDELGAEDTLRTCRRLERVNGAGSDRLSHQRAGHRCCRCDESAARTRWRDADLCRPERSGRAADRVSRSCADAVRRRGRTRSRKRCARSTRRRCSGRTGFRIDGVLRCDAAFGLRCCGRAGCARASDTRRRRGDHRRRTPRCAELAWQGAGRSCAARSQTWQAMLRRRRRARERTGGFTRCSTVS